MINFWNVINSLYIKRDFRFTCLHLCMLLLQRLSSDTSSLSIIGPFLILSSTNLICECNRTNIILTSINLDCFLFSPPREYILMKLFLEKKIKDMPILVSYEYHYFLYEITSYACFRRKRTSKKIGEGIW